MSEVTLPLIELPAGKSFQNATDDTAYIITEDHTISDILRYLLTQVEGEEIEFLLLEMIG